MNLKVFVIYSSAASEEMSWNMIEDSGERLKGEWKLLFQKVIIITYFLAFLLPTFFFSLVFLPPWEIRMGYNYTWKRSESHINFSVHMFYLQKGRLRIWWKRAGGRQMGMWKSIPGSRCMQLSRITWWG